MGKKLSAAVGSYQKDGQQKTRWQNIGVILEKDGKEFCLLDPTVDLGAVLQLQNMESMKAGKEPSDRIMVGVFEEQQQGYQQSQQYAHQPSPSAPMTSQQYRGQQPQPPQFDDDVPQF